MSVAPFLADLFETGRVVVSPPAPEEADEALDAVLVPAERIFRSTLAGEAPPCLLPAARWAARRFYGACQFLVCRDLGAPAMQRFFADPCPVNPTAAAHYSVDLVFQYLPELVALARSLAAGDPLMEHLLALARTWPLSSVGVPDCGPVQVERFMGDRSLAQLYVDRILARNDLSRLTDPQVADWARESIGAFPELCPPVAERLGMVVGSERI